MLIVDDLKDKLEFMETVVKSVFGAETYEVILCTSEVQANQAIRDRGHEIAIALIDAYLTEPPAARSEGLVLASRLREIRPEAYIILVSRFIEDRGELRNDSPIDDFVHLMYTKRSNPLADLQAALRRAEQSVGHDLVPTA